MATAGSGLKNVTFRQCSILSVPVNNPCQNEIPTDCCAGIETHFPNWNWAGFPASYLLAGSAYLAGNWFITGLVVGAIRRKLESGVAD
jgi:hypothetical protein